MAVHLHEEDLPADVEIRRRADRRRYRGDGPRCPAATGCASSSCPMEGRRASRAVQPRKRLFGAQPQGAAVRPDRLKLYHFARFDVGIMQAYLGIMAAPLYCTRTASRLVRTYTDRHGLKDLVKELLNVDLSKQQQPATGAPTSSATRSATMPRATCAISMRSRKSSTSGWSARTATALAQACFDFLPARALLDIAGWPEQDIFAHDG